MDCQTKYLFTSYAKPFVKWAGGKNQLLEQFNDFYPAELRNGVIKNYVEPFLGGGALFFAITQRYKVEKAYLSDKNHDLILTYHVVQKKPAELIEFLEQYQNKYDITPQEKRKELFLEIRKQFNNQRFEIDYEQIADSWIMRAAQFIFLNKTCFNGLFRINSTGEFNVPYGKYKVAKICDKENILAASNLLKNAKIRYADYSCCLDVVDGNSFVYLDPPYRPISPTASFTTYIGTEFRDSEQLKLANFYRKLDREKGAKLMLSNSDPTNENADDNFFEEAYSGFRIFKVLAGRAVNCNGEKRGKINELVIVNY